MVFEEGSPLVPGGQSYIESLLGQATALFIWAPPGSASLGPLPTLRPAATPPALLPTPPPFPPVFLSLPRWLGDKKSYLPMQEAQ